jgi:hypothetical protein
LTALDPEPGAGDHCRLGAGLGRWLVGPTERAASAARSSAAAWPSAR